MAPASSLESRAMLARIAAMSPNHHKTIACSTFASRPHVRVRLSQPARRLMTWSVTATHDSANLGPARWRVALRRTRLVLVAAAVAFGALWMLGTIAAAPALVGFAAIAAAALLASVNTRGSAGALDERRAERGGPRRPVDRSPAVRAAGSRHRPRPSRRCGRAQRAGRRDRAGAAAGRVGLARAARSRSVGRSPQHARERDVTAYRILAARAAGALVRSRRNTDI